MKNMKILKVTVLFLLVMLSSCVEAVGGEKKVGTNKSVQGKVMHLNYADFNKKVVET